MGALPRPELPPGPRRQLSDALHDLHRQAGWPSLRALGRETGVSHTTVSKVMSAPVLPSWGTLELLVEAMRGDTGEFQGLWLAASLPDDPSDRGETPVRIAGRRTELAAVRRQLETGTGLLLVTGEAGIGKTALLQAAAGGTRKLIAIGRCLPLSDELPLLPLAELLAAIHDVDGGGWLEEALVGTPRFVRWSLARVLPELEGDVAAPSNDEFTRQRLFIAVGTALARLAELRPLALGVEDLHWADPGTLDLLEHLLARSMPVPVVGTWRTEDDATPRASDAWFARVQRLRDVSVLPIGPLSPSETVDQLVLRGVRSRERQDSIYSRTLGQPLFTDQLAAHLDEGHGLPDLLADLLLHRINSLPEPAWAVLRSLGLAQHSLPPDQLAAASKLEPEELTTQLRALRDRRLLRARPDTLVELRHPLLAEAIEHRLVPGEGARVHRSLAEVLGAAADAPAAEVAHHWRRARDRERELEWRVRAARAAAAAYEWGLEAESWVRVLDLWPSGTDTVGDPALSRAEVYLAAIDALVESLQSDRAAAMTADAGVRLGAMDDEFRAELLARAAELRGDREGTAVGLLLVDESLEIFAGLPASHGRLRALNLRRLLLQDLGRYDDAVATAQAAVEVARQIGDLRQQRHHLDTVASHQGAVDGPSRTLELIAKSRALLPEDADPLGDIRAAVIATDVLLTWGRSLEEVQQAAEPGLVAAAAWGIDNTQSMMLRANLATALLRAGRVAQADAVIGVLGDQPPDPDRWPLELLGARIDCAQGETARAADRIHRVYEEVTTQDELDLEALGMVADVDYWGGAARVSLAGLIHGLALVADSVPVREMAPALVLAARGAADGAARHRGASQAAVDDIRDLLARVRRRLRSTDRDDPYLGVHLAMAEAELTPPDGHGSLARWTRLAHTWSELDRPHEAAYCRWRAALVAHRVGQGTVASRLLVRASAEAREHVPLSRAIAATQVELSGMS